MVQAMQFLAVPYFQGHEDSLLAGRGSAWPRHHLSSGRPSGMRFGGLDPTGPASGTDALHVVDLEIHLATGASGAPGVQSITRQSISKYSSL